MAIRCWSLPMRLMLVALLISLAVVESKDLYKILGVEKNASQREIQKAFHRLSLKYHPDKNPAKSAQAKFAEINNAYEVLSDEEKRKNYDLFGDEQGRAREAQENHGDYSGFHNSKNYGSSQGWTHFSYDSSDGKRYRFEQHGNDFGPGEASFTQGGFYNFPFGSSSGRREQSSTFGFGGDSSYFGNFFENLFSSAKDRQYSGYSTGSGKSRGKSSFQGTQTNQFSIESEQLTPKSFQKKVLDQLYTWAVIFSPGVSKNLQEKLQVLEDISSNLRESIKVGYVNCETHKTLCKEQHIWPVKAPKLVLYSLRSNGKLSPSEYTGEWSVKDVKNYCVEALPRFSKHVHIEELEDRLNMEPNIPHVVLFTRKKEAAAVWRALSGLFHGRVVFYDVQVDEDDFPRISSKFAVNSLPAVVGIYENGEIHALSSGNRLELISSSLEEFKGLIQKFEERSKAAGPRKAKAKADNEIPLLTKNNFKNICNQDTALCIIGVYKSASGKESVKKILKEISQKSLTRRGQRLDSRNPVSYAVLDANKQSAFLGSFDQKTFKGRDVVLVAYKPKKKTYVLYDGPRTLEDIENFVVEVISGDVQLKSVLRDPILA